MSQLPSPDYNSKDIVPVLELEIMTKVPQDGYVPLGSNGRLQGLLGMPLGYLDGSDTYRGLIGC